jgi:hypothetical protein
MGLRRISNTHHWQRLLPTSPTAENRHPLEEANEASLETVRPPWRYRNRDSDQLGAPWTDNLPDPSTQHRAPST